jgi:PAS domain S-box-containing protein
VEVGSSASKFEPPFRELFALSPDATLLFVAGTVTHANEAAARLFAVGSSANLIGHRSTELLHPNCVPAVERRVVEFMRNRVRWTRAAETYVRFDGTAVDVETTVSRATFLKGKAFIVSLREASPNKRGSDIVREWDARYNLTSAEAFVLRNALRGSSRSEITRLLCVAPSTLKKHVHNLVQKTGDASLNAAVQRVLRERVDRP